MLCWACVRTVREYGAEKYLELITIMLLLYYAVLDGQTV